MGTDVSDEMSKTTSLMYTVAFGAFFLALDHLLAWALKPWLAKLAMNDKKQRSGRARIVAIQAVTKIVSTIHNCVQIPLALLVLSDPVMYHDRLHARSGPSLWMLHISTGYFLMDLFNCIMRYETEGPAFLLHAACCFSVFMYASWSNTLHYYGAAFLMWEWSTFCVHLRWLLIKLGYGDTRIAVINGVLMMIAFFMCRIAWGWYSSFQFFQDTRVELTRPPGPEVIPPFVIHLFLVANLALNALNSWWFCLMIKGAAQALSGRAIGDAGRHRSD